MSAELYRNKLTELLFDRPLPEEQESERVAELEQIWWSLSPAEQQEIEEDMARVPDAPESLGLADRVAATGVTPRVPC